MVVELVLGGDLGLFETVNIPEHLDQGLLVLNPVELALRLFRYLCQKSRVESVLYPDMLEGLAERSDHREWLFDPSLGADSNRIDLHRITLGQLSRCNRIDPAHVVVSVGQ